MAGKTEKELKGGAEAAEMNAEELCAAGVGRDVGPEPCDEGLSGKENADGSCAADQESSSDMNGAGEAAAGNKDDEDLQSKFLRLSADFQNFRRRSETEKADIYAYANEKIVLQLLDVIDNFDRAMQAAAEGDKFAEGMRLILKQLEEILAKNNVSEIEALGRDFDPNFHHAVMTEAGEESNKITQVLQKGYTLNGKVIRPSMVAVSQ